jgi:colicin import membrane protein
VRETRADTAQAILYAVALHVALVVLVVMGMWWTRTHSVVSAAGEPVEADIVDANALSAPMQRALRSRPVTAPPMEAATPPPQPIPEPRPEDAPVQQQVKAQEPVPVPDTIDQERVDRDALSAQTREREQEEKRRQEQIDLTERERQDEAEKRQRLARQAELQRQLADIRKQRAQAAKAAESAEQKLQQIADARARNAAQAATQADAAASPPPGNNGADSDLAARYAAALQDAILRNWTRPDSVPQGQRCKLNIRQLPGGEVIDVQVAASCPYDDLGKRSVEAAVLKAQPLPYAGFEAVFSRNLTVNFEAQDR